MKSYDIINLHCGGCASKIQDKLQQLDGIKDVNLDFYTKKLRLNVIKDWTDEQLLKNLNKVADKVEPGTYFVEITSNTSKLNVNKEKKENKNLMEKIDLILLTIGITLFVVGLTLDKSLQKDIILIIAFILSGYDVLLQAIKNIKKGRFLDENFLMSIATIGAIGLKDFGEAAGVMIFYKIGEFFQEIAVNKSKKSIEKLMSIKPDFANLKEQNGEIKVIAPSEVKIGDVLVVKPGERIPLDGIIVFGTTTLDKSALTGEAIPMIAEIGTEVLSGSINIDGTIEFKVTKEYSESTVSRIIEMVENAGSKKAVAEKFITKFARYYTPLVVVLAIIIAFFIPLTYDGQFRQWFGRALIFLVISCPCALVLSVPLTFFSSIGKGSREGILIKGGNYLERLKNIDSVVFDKTGTLTKGTFKVKKIEHMMGTEKELLEYAKAGELYSTHPIGKAILNYGNIDISENDIEGHKEKAGYGIYVLYKNKEILIGSRKYLEEYNIEVSENNNKIGTVVYVAVNSVLFGKIYVEDEVKETSKKAVESLKNFGVDVYMLTGDTRESGEYVADILGIDRDKVYAELLPQDKVSKLEKIKNKSKKGTIFIGDGINDAPVLALADVGIAMGQLGSDIAIESSDIVLMNDDPYKVMDVLKLGKRNAQVVIQNIVFALGVKIVVMILGVLGFANLWMAIFADVGVSVLAVLNASKILREKTK